MAYYNWYVINVALNHQSANPVSRVRYGEHSVAEVRRITVDETSGGQRIDNFLHRWLKGVPRTRLYRLLRRGEVRVNGGRIKPSYRLCGGDEVRLPPVRTGETAPNTPSARVLERLAQAIRYEDDHLLVVDKPSGMAVHAGSGVAYGLVEALRWLRPQVGLLDLAHRLDRHTSGIVVLCKGRQALSQVHQQFREGAVGKYYVTLVRGRLPRGEMPVTARLARHTGKGGETFVEVAADGKASRTTFWTLEALGRRWTLSRCRPETGRMHQIRVHAAYMGYPIAGDQRYGAVEANQIARRAGLKRLFLHAEQVCLQHPAGGTVAFDAPLPSDLTTSVERLRHE